MLEQSLQHEAIALAPVVGLWLAVILLLPIIGLGVIRLLVALAVNALAVIRLLAVNHRWRRGRQLPAVVRLLLAVTRRWGRAVTWLLWLAVTGLLLLAITGRRLLGIPGRRRDRQRLRRIDGFVVRQALARHR